MRKFIFLIMPLLFVWFISANNSFPEFPMTIYWDIKIWQNDLGWWVLKIYNSSDIELAEFNIITNWKYWSNNATETHLLLNNFNWNIVFKVTYNWKIYIIDSINDDNRWEWCPSKDSITFVSKNCRYDLTFKEESNNNWWWNSWWSWWWGWGWWWWGWWWGWWGGWWWGWSSDATTNDNPATNSWARNTWNDSTIESGNSVENPINNWNPQEVLANWYTRELNNAYTFAYKNGITTMKTIEQANMNWSLTRIAMAKMLSQYAINILKKTPNTNKQCIFWDVTMQMDSDYSNWVTLACQLWIMWVWITNFRPNDLVTRAEFGTALSRMLFGLADGTDKYYSTHLAKLKKEWIISNDDPTLKELRWYVMLMLMRSSK